MEVVDIVKHYQRSLERCSGDEQRMLHCICKLCRLPVTVQHLQETGVGRTVNALRKYEGDVGNAAKALVLKWKAMVAEADSSEEETSNNCERAKTESPPPPKISVSKIRSHNLEVPDSHRENRTLEKGETSSESQPNSNNSVKVSSKSSQSKLSHYSTNKRHIEDDCSETAVKHKRCVVHVQDEEEEGNDSGRDSHEENEDSDASRNDSDLNEDYQVNSIEIDSVNGDNQNLNQNDDLSSGSENKVKYEHRSSSKREKTQSSNSSYNKHSSHKHSSPSVKNHSSGSSIHEKSRRRESGNSEHKHKNSEKKCEHKNSVDNSSKESKGKNKDKRKEKDIVKRKEREKEKNKEKKISSKLEPSDNKKNSKSEKVLSKTDGKPSSSKSSSSKSETKHKTSSIKKKKSSENTEDGIDSFSGTSFADALGMMGMMDSVKKKKKSNSLGNTSSKKSERPPENLPSTSTSSSKISKLASPKQQGKATQEEINLLDPSLKLEPLDNFEMEMEVDVDATLPAITPNYRPLPHLNFDAHSRGRTRTLTEEEALSQVMSTKNQRTKVYSGVKSGKSWATVPSLYDICVRVLQENIDALEYTGGVPYDLLKPVLSHATPDQLFVLEHYNPYLVEDTDELWKLHVGRKFRNKSRLDMETYREMFQRCVEESEAKLKALTMNIQNSMAKSVPVRQTKLAYVDSVAKPPRQVARKQAKYGTAHATPTTPLAKVQKLASPVGSGSGSNSSVNHVPPPPRATHSVTKTKPRVAPLMQKTLKFAKSFKR